jgi:hypothetical protein
VTRAKLALRDHKGNVAGQDHRESVESLVKAEKDMIHLQDNIQVGCIIKMDQIK